MNRGAVIFAYNNDHIDYLKLATWSAQNIQRHLDIPVSVITDGNPESDVFDQVIHTPAAHANYREFADLKGVVTWYNTNRMSVYELSPYDHTMVIDADYVVASNQLATMFDAESDFVAHKDAYDVTRQRNLDDENTFGHYHMPMWWATVMFFRRGQLAKEIFSCMQMIYNNWDHYSYLYANRQSYYRNDHALAIALGTVYGHTLDHPEIPWRLASVIPEHGVTQVAKDHYKIDYVDAENKPRYLEIKNQDFHAMGKSHLEKLIADNT